MNRPGGAVLGVRTVDGAIVPVYDCGRAVANRVLFTTVADGQRQAVFEFYCRGRDAEPWVYVDSLCLTPLPAARAGIPDLRLDARPDHLGGIDLRLVDPKTGSPAVFVLDSSTLQGLLRKQIASETGGAAPATSAHEQRTGLLPIAAAVVVLLAGGGLVLFTAGKLPRRGPITATFQNAAAVSREIAVAAPASPETPPAPSPPAAVPAAVKAPAAPNATPVPAVTGARLVPPSTATTEYRIVRGDTLCRIAERFYGDRRLYAELAETNVLANPNLIITGESLQLPPVLGIHQRRSAGE